MSRINLFFFFSLLAFTLNAKQNKELTVHLPEIIVAGIEYEVILQAEKPIEEKQMLLIDQDQSKAKAITFDENQQAKVLLEFTEKGEYTFQLAGREERVFINPIPLWLSIIPPLIAILLALLFKEVVTSLLLGLFFGAFIIQIHLLNFWEAVLQAFMNTIDHYLVNALYDRGHLSIILFSLFIGGMVSVISKNGGMQGIVNKISKYASDARKGQLASWFLGMAIFFDDYANTLIVGNTMRPITDRLKISREKLAYIVDSTAAPMAAIALITTWVGAELGYIESGISQIDGLNVNVYATFISSLAYSFYPIFALVFMFILLYRQRDFGPMLVAEKGARTSTAPFDNKVETMGESAEFQAKKDIPARAYNAIIPILLVIFGTIAGLLFTGWDSEIVHDKEMDFFQKLSSIIGNSNSYQALLWSSFAGLILSIKMSVFGKILKLGQSVEALLSGFKTMMPAMIILVLAWSLALVIEDLQTAGFLTSILSDQIIPQMIPLITFILAALIAFATGSSWGTMAILYPIMISTSWTISQEGGIAPAAALSILHNVIASVLAGAVLGDHCSPISDTTILSSLASSCNHIEHVKTQMPYALTVGGVATLFGVLPTGFGMPSWIAMILGIVILFLIIQFFGKKVDT